MIFLYCSQKKRATKQRSFRNIAHRDYSIVSSTSRKVWYEDLFPRQFKLRQLWLLATKSFVRAAKIEIFPEQTDGWRIFSATSDRLGWEQSKLVEEFLGHFKSTRIGISRVTICENIYLQNPCAWKHLRAWSRIPATVLSKHRTPWNYWNTETCIFIKEE
jgi:hypothetical protein